MSVITVVYNHDNVIAIVFAGGLILFQPAWRGAAGQCRQCGDRASLPTRCGWMIIHPSLSLWRNGNVMLKSQRIMPMALRARNNALLTCKRESHHNKIVCRHRSVSSCSTLLLAASVSYDVLFAGYAGWCDGVLLVYSLSFISY